jgi:hypothetical protein
MSSLWDMSEAEITLSEEEIKALSALVGANWGKSGAVKSAIVVSEDLAYGLARMYQAHLSGSAPSPVLITRDLQEARRWLGMG